MFYITFLSSPYLLNNITTNLQTFIKVSVRLFTTITGLGRKNWRGGFSQESMILTNATISNILISPSLFISAPSKSTAAGLRI